MAVCLQVKVHGLGLGPQRVGCTAVCCLSFYINVTFLCLWFVFVGGGLGNTRRGGADMNTKYSGRDDFTSRERWITFTAVH